MASKTNVRKDIKESTDAIKEVMRENLSYIAENMIEQIMSKYRRLTDSQRFNSIKDISTTGVSSYKEALLSAYAVVAADALEKARKEVPAKKNVKLAFDEESLKLGEFDKLPPDIKRRLMSMLGLMIGKQMSDLEAAIFFQFNSSIDSTDSESLLSKDLKDSAEEFIAGNAINAGASAAAGQIVNEARLAFFLDDEVSKEIEAFEFVNGDPVSEICQELAGSVFSKDDPNLHRYYPPLHFNCKSWIRPILVGNLGTKEIKAIRVTAKAEKSIQFGEFDFDLILREIARPREGQLQTIIVSKEVAKSLEGAKQIARDVGAEHLDVDETESSYRFRQRRPSDFLDGSFKSHVIDKKGATLVYGKLKA